MQSSSSRPSILWTPNPGRQSKFLACAASEVLYGGAASGGKSAATIALPLRFVGNPNFNALVLRRDTPQLADLLGKSFGLYSKFGAKLNQTTGRWVFPSGARVWFTHCQHETDVARFDGHEFQLVCFDELTHFTEKQYTQIRARIRGTDPTLPRWTRATTNPGGPGHEWVLKRWRAWLDPAHPEHANEGEIRWFAGDERTVPGAPGSLSRTFIPAALADNPHVNADEYRAQLAQLDPVRRAQLEHGDWMRRRARKDMWDRERIPHIDSLDGYVVSRVPAWDFAATADGGDWTVGVRMALLDSGVVVVEDVVRFQCAPPEVRKRFAQTAGADALEDPRTAQVIPQDPGQAGKDQVSSYQREFPRLTIRSRRPTGDKLTRFNPVSARAMSGAGALVVLRRDWNDDYHVELEDFPSASPDDQVDATSDAYAELTTPLRIAREGSYDF